MCERSMNPWRDVALNLELGDRVVTDLMTLEDWVDMIELATSRHQRAMVWERSAH